MSAYGKLQYLTLVRAPLYFVAHLLIIYALSFFAFSSLIACVARDLGPVPGPKSENVGGGSGSGGAPGGGGDKMSIEGALLSTAVQGTTASVVYIASSLSTEANNPLVHAAHPELTMLVLDLAFQHRVSGLLRPSGMTSRIRTC